MHTNKLYFLFIISLALSAGAPPVVSRNVEPYRPSDETQSLGDEGLVNVTSYMISWSDDSSEPHAPTHATRKNIKHARQQLGSGRTHHQAPTHEEPATPVHHVAGTRNITAVEERQQTLATLVEQGLIQTQLLERTFRVIQEFLPD